MEIFSTDVIKKGQSRIRKTVVRKHELEMHDSLFNKFYSATDDKDYIQIAQSAESTVLRPDIISYSHRLFIDNNV